MQTETPSLTISMIIPIFGVEKYIAKFADSALSQSYPHIEFIFVDDATQDRSVAILEDLIDKKYSHRKAQTKIIHKAKNEGLPAARKTGVEHATGEYVLHADSDDWLAEDCVLKIAQKIQSSRADIVYFNYTKEYPTRAKKKRVNNYTNEQRKLFIQDMYNHKTAASVWNKCFRRTLYTEHDIFIPRYGYAEDCCLTTQLVGYANSIAYLDDYLYHYRKGNPQALTKQKVRNRKREYAINILDLYDAYRTLPIEHNPIAPIKDIICIQAGWYSLLYGLGVFSNRPYLAQAVRRAKIRRSANVWICSQIITKCYVFLTQRK